MVILGKNSQYVADYLLLNSESLTPLKINKLTFFSHGWMLGTHSSPLIYEDVEAWQYGPIIPSIYHSFKRYGRNVVEVGTYFQKNEDCIKEYKASNEKLFNPSELGIMKDVIEHYSYLSHGKIIGITHKKDSPWKKCYDKNKHHIVIPDSLIQDYYGKFIKN